MGNTLKIVVEAVTGRESQEGDKGRIDQRGKKMKLDKLQVDFSSNHN